MRNIAFLGDFAAVESLCRDTKELHRVIGELSLLRANQYPLVHLYFEPHRMTIETTYFDAYNEVQIVTTAYHNHPNGYWIVRSAT